MDREDVWKMTRQRPQKLLVDPEFAKLIKASAALQGATIIDFTKRTAQRNFTKIKMPRGMIDIDFDDFNE